MIKKLISKLFKPKTFKYIINTLDEKGLHKREVNVIIKHKWY